MLLFPSPFSSRLVGCPWGHLLSTTSPLGRNLTNAETAHVDCGVIDRESALDHHLFQVTVAQGIPQVPAHAQQNKFRLKMTPFEWTRMTHDGNSPALLTQSKSRAYHIISLFATQ